MSQTVYHVVPYNEQWAVKKQGGEQASRLAGTQEEAVAHAEQFARHQAPSRIVIHRQDGTIESQQSFELADRPPATEAPSRIAPRVLGGVAVALLVGVGIGGLAWMLRNRE